MDKDQIMESAFQIVSFAGDAKSIAMEAIALAKENKIEEANAKINTARETIANAHHNQTDLISAEANGQELPFSVLLIHSQDHLMTSMTVIDLAQEIVELYSKIN